MHAAITLAKTAARLGEVPVAAVITDNAGNIIASAHNETEAGNNATHHAELLAIARACTALGDKILEDCTLTVTLEPCAMCAGAIAAVRLKRIVFGAYDPKSGGVEHGARVFAHSHHRPEIIGGIMESECAMLLTDFFIAKR